MTKTIAKALLTVSVSLFAMGLNAANVDLASSKFVWKVDKKVGDGHTGEIKLLSAKAELDGDKIKSGEFVMDMANFTVTDLDGKWAKKFLTHVRSGDFFEADKYKTAKLVIKEQVGKNKVKGLLTIKDKTKPVTVEFKKKGKSYKGTMVFNRTKWGITYGSLSFLKSLSPDKVIKDDIQLTFDVVLK